MSARPREREQPPHAAPHVGPPAAPRAQSRPLRIAVFVHEFPTLSETFVLNQVTGLIDAGHDVTILANARPTQEQSHRDVDRYGLVERTIYQDLPAGHGARAVAALRLFGRRGVRRLALLRALNPVRFGRDALSLRLYVWAARLAKAPPFDIIHCHFGPMGRMAADLRRIGALRGRLVTTFHGVDMSAYLDNGPGFYRRLFAEGDVFLPISQLWGRSLIDMGAPADRVAVHRMGVDLERFVYTQRRRDGPLRILTVGRLVEKKGIDTGLRAVADLLRHGIAVRYDIVGDGVQYDSLRLLAKTLGLSAHVKFYGWADQQAVIRRMTASDVLLAPSRTDSSGDQEGIPVTLMEAMATGLPVVATRHSGIPELVEDGVSGLLAEEDDVAGIAAALSLLAEEPGLAQRLSSAARQKIEAEYDVDRLNERLVSLFNALADWDRKGAASGD